MRGVMHPPNEFGSHTMKIQKNIVLLLAIILSSIAQAAADEVKLETLLKTQLEGVEGTEVIVSKVYIPANTSLPKHWHPGEEFVYILEGSVTLWQKGKENITGNMGEIIKVPLKQVHTGITGSDGVSLLVFRVHEQGKPERVKAE
jgi:quercetin dioxygenase-like cupin family protein